MYEDTDLDSIPDILLTSLDGLFLLPGDSAIVDPEYTAGNLSAVHIFWAEAFFADDMDTSNNYVILKIYPGYPPAALVINEVMYSPEGGEPEWVELYNKSTDSIDLINWTISDVITTPSRTRIDSNLIIPPKNYMVLSKDSSLSEYHRIIPSPVEVINLPVLNNDADGVVLKDERGQIMDSLYFNSTWGGKQGYSLERVSVSLSTNISSNWGSSEDIELSTPGRVNSITPKNKDISITGISSDPKFPVEGENVFITAMIKNKGRLNASGIAAEFYIDSDSNNTPDKLISLQEGLSLNADDSLLITSSGFPR